MELLFYNAAHTYVLPAILAAWSLRLDPKLLTISIIWASHIAFDRILGFGLKYPTDFKDTHLQHLDSMRQ